MTFIKFYSDDYHLLFIINSVLLFVVIIIYLKFNIYIMNKIIILVSLLYNFIFPQISFALPKIEYEKDKNIEFFQSVQIFNVYTISNDSNIDNRNDLFIRRGRFGLQGKLEKDLNYKICFAYDNVGKDSKTKIWGLAQNTENSNFSIFDAFFTYKLVNNLANITLGFFRPQIGRESITPAFEVTSFEKALTNFYIRPHLVGRANGRDTGINLGGLYSLGSDILFNFDNFNFDAEFDLLSRNSKGNDYYQDNVFHIRASYNINVYNNYFLEPMIMYSQSNISSKSSLAMPSETEIDLGFNFYINKNYSKFLAHVIKRNENNKSPIYLISLGTQFLY